MHVVVNAAMSADGKLSSRRREQVRISGEADLARVDRLRAEADAVVVGVGTVLADDPSIVRYDRDHRDRIGKSGAPARAVVDSRARTPADAAVVQGDPPTYLLTSDAAPEDRLDDLRSAGVEVVAAGSNRVDLPAAMDGLESRGVADLMVEGGGELIFSLFADDLVDDLSVYVGAMVIGGRDSPTLVDGEGFVDEFPRLTLADVDRLDDGVVLHWDT